MEPVEIVAKELRDLDAKRATQQAWMQPVLSTMPWEAVSEAARTAWTGDLKSGLRKLREATGCSVFLVREDGSLAPWE